MTSTDLRAERPFNSKRPSNLQIAVYRAMYMSSPEPWKRRNAPWESASIRAARPRAWAHERTAFACVHRGTWSRYVPAPTTIRAALTLSATTVVLSCRSCSGVASLRRAYPSGPSLSSKRPGGSHPLRGGRSAFSRERQVIVTGAVCRQLDSTDGGRRGEVSEKRSARRHHCKPPQAKTDNDGRLSPAANGTPRTGPARLADIAIGGYPDNRHVSGRQ